MSSLAARPAAARELIPAICVPDGLIRYLGDALLTASAAPGHERWAAVTWRRSATGPRWPGFQVRQALTGKQLGSNQRPFACKAG